jgi:CelD/BcsL family acetyltransferase involved in cellulose biosynthesis
VRAEVLDRLTPALLDPWERLFAADPDATPFSSPAWGQAWLEHWGRDAVPRLVAVYDGDRVVGLAPLALHRHGPVRLLRVLGEDPSDHWNVLAAERELREPVTRAVGQALAGARETWDALVLSRLPPEPDIRPALEAAGLRVHPRPPAPYPSLSLPRSFDDYLRSLPQRRRTNLRRRLRHLDEGELTLLEITEPAELGPAMERWHQLRVGQWDRRGKQMLEMHREARFPALLSAALARLVPAGMAWVWELRRGERLAGSYVNFLDESCFYQYLGGFDPEYAELGIGRIVTAHAIRRSIERGLERYDFGLGGGDFKYSFGAEDRLSPAYLCTSRSPRSRAFGALMEARRRLRERLP